MEMDFAGIMENILTRDEFPLARAQEILAKEKVAIIGYGIQGTCQSQNLRDNGIDVIVGVRPNGGSWKRAQEDGWIPGMNLFPIEEAADMGTIVEYLISDAGQKEQWPLIKRSLKEGDALYFSHGFSVVYSQQTEVVPPRNVDVIMVAPKGSGTSLRRLFLEGCGINSSYAVYQDYTGKALDRTFAIGIAIGSAYLFETTFEKEVYSDLTGERGSLMGAIYGMWLAQYEILRERGHSPSESFNETVEEATQSLYPLIAEKGMDWMYANCSATAQRGALDWYLRFRDVLKPLFHELYERVKSGAEAQGVLEANSRPDYLQELQKELAQIKGSEMWETGTVVRSLRPK